MSEDKPRDSRRVYYDHEPAYEAIERVGGEGWDDLPQKSDLKDDAFGSYVSLSMFIESDDFPEPTRVIEFGCGGGQASFMLAELGFDATGVDFSETAVRIARKNAEKRGLDARFERADVTDMSAFDDEDFGLALDNHCLHCLVEPEDRAAMLNEAFRLLEPGGLLFVDTMSSEGDFDADAIGCEPGTTIGPARTRIWVSEGRLRNEVEDAGFEIVWVKSRPEEPKTGDLLTVLARRPA